MGNFLVTLHSRGYRETTYRYISARDQSLKLSREPYKLESHRTYRWCLVALSECWIQNQSALTICNDLSICFKLWYRDGQCFYYANTRLFSLLFVKIFLPRAPLNDVHALIASNYIESWPRHTLRLNIFQMVFRSLQSILLWQGDQDRQECLFISLNFSIGLIHRDFS